MMVKILLVNKMVSVDIDPATTTVLSLKEQLRDLTGMPVESFHNLTIAKPKTKLKIKLENDEKTLVEYDFEKNDLIYLASCGAVIMNEEKVQAYIENIKAIYSEQDATDS